MQFQQLPFMTPHPQVQGLFHPAMGFPGNIAGNVMMYNAIDPQLVTGATQEDDPQSEFVEGEANRKDARHSPDSLPPPHARRKKQPMPNFQLPDKFGQHIPLDHADPYKSPQSPPILDSDDDDLPDPSQPAQKTQAQEPSKSKSRSEPKARKQASASKSAKRDAKNMGGKKQGSAVVGDIEKNDRGRAFGGRMKGSRNFGAPETKELLRLIEIYTPVAAKGWDAVKAEYTKFAAEEGFADRDAKSLKDKFYRLVNEPKPTGTGVKPDMIAKAQRLDRSIEEKGGAATVDDMPRDASPIVLESEDDTVGEDQQVGNSEDEIVVVEKVPDREKKTKGGEKKKEGGNDQTVGTKAYRVQPPLPPPNSRRNNTAATASSALTSLTSFFNPDAAIERDQARASNAFQLAALNQSHNEVQALRARLDTMTDRYQEAVQRADRSGFQVDLLQREVDSLKREADSFKREAESYKREIDSLKRRRRHRSSTSRDISRSRSRQRERPRYSYNQSSSPYSSRHVQSSHSQRHQNGHRYSSESRTSPPRYPLISASSSTSQVYGMSSRSSPISFSQHELDDDMPKEANPEPIHLVLTPTRTQKGEKAFTITPRKTT
ncbi:hypothetical protein H0H93_015416 [Arthromyces matolae]|nr:hypothetical protein H0H93_015416 [Arthromyces matolae]